MTLLERLDGWQRIAFVIGAAWFLFVFGFVSWKAASEGNHIVWREPTTVPDQYCGADGSEWLQCMTLGKKECDLARDCYWKEDQVTRWNGPIDWEYTLGQWGFVLVSAFAPGFLLLAGVSVFRRTFRWVREGFYQKR